MPKRPPLTRRTLVALSAGSVAAATLGPLTKVCAAPPNTITVLNEDPGDLMNRLAGLRAQGYRPLSVAIYGSPTKNATTFIQRAGPAWDLVAAQTKADLDIYMWACWLTGYRLSHLAATGSAASPIFIALIENCTASTFIGQLRNRILTPLGALRVRVSPGPIGSHPLDEAAYDAPRHDDLWALNVGPSVFTSARPMVPYVYGADLDYRCVDAGAGLSAAAPDLAKILTSITGPTGSVLNQVNRDRMLVRGGSLATPTPAAWAETRIGFDHSGGAVRGGEKGGWFLGEHDRARGRERLVVRAALQQQRSLRQSRQRSGRVAQPQPEPTACRQPGVPLPELQHPLVSLITNPAKASSQLG